MGQGTNSTQHSRHNARINPPFTLDVKKGASEWQQFHEMWKNYSNITRLDHLPWDNLSCWRGFKLQLTRLVNETEASKKALFLNRLNHNSLCVYNGKQFPDDHTVSDIIAAFNTYFIGKMKETDERYVLKNKTKKSEDSFHNFIAAVRTLVKTCNFCDHIKDFLLCNQIRHNSTRKQKLQESELFLTVCLDMWRAPEPTESMKSDESLANSNFINPGGKRPTVTKTKTCKFCDKSHVLRKETGPAWSKMCKKCL